MELRKSKERRIREQKWRHDRRVRPDRRLNSILVEWIPFSEFASLTTVRKAPGSPNKLNHNNKSKCKETSPHDQSLVCIFSHKLANTVDLRKGPDRRTKQQTRPYNRRVHPDRRLSNISVEWIPFYYDHDGVAER